MKSCLTATFHKDQYTTCKDIPAIARAALSNHFLAGDRMGNEIYPLYDAGALLRYGHDNFSSKTLDIPKKANAPIIKNQEYGKALYVYKNSPVGITPLLASEDIPANKFVSAASFVARARDLSTTFAGVVTS